MGAVPVRPAGPLAAGSSGTLRRMGGPLRRPGHRVNNGVSGTELSAAGVPVSQDALEALSAAVTLSTAVRDDAGVAVDMRLDYMNAAARAGQPEPRQAIGELCSRLWPHMIENGSFAACMRVLDTGVAEHGQFRWDHLGTYQPGGYTFHASRLGTDTLLWELRDANAELRRAQLLADITAALARAEQPDDVLAILITHAVMAVGAAAGAAVVQDPATERYVVVSGYNTEDVAPARFAFDVNSPYPMAHTARTGEPLYFGTAAERTAAFPAAEHFFAGRYASTAVLPLRVDERLLGGVSFHFAEPRDFTPGDRAFLTALTGQCAQALERTRLREDSERAQTQLQVLAGLSEQMAAVVDEHSALQLLTAAVVPRLADGCLVHLADTGPGPRLAASAHVDADELRNIRSLLDRFPAALSSPFGVGHVLRTGRPEVVTDVPAMFDTIARSSEHRTALAQFGATSWLVAPMHHAGRRLGVLTLMRSDGPPFHRRDLPFVTELAQRGAAAATHARSYAQQRHVARVLQQSLLPRRLPTIAGVDFGSCYHTSAPGLEAGGDFYDVFTGPENLLAVTIGDICGTGPVAASRTALVRHSARAFGRLDPHPAQVAAAINTAMLEEARDGCFCTLAYATLRIRPDATTLRLVLAGHPPPFVRRAGGRVEQIGTPGTVLGVTPTPRLSTTEHELHRGDILVFYTDGAIERRDADTFLQEEGLQRLIAAAPAGSAADMVRHLETGIIGHSSQPLRDDLAILAVQVR